MEYGYRDQLGRDVRKGVERALRWYPGSVKIVLDGGEPMPFSRLDEDDVSAMGQDEAPSATGSERGLTVDDYDQIQAAVQALTEAIAALTVVAGILGRIKHPHERR